MKPSEVDQELSELDDKIDRVRALYEQYFLGLEKLEPQVPRKEIDRRIWSLRREQIRNTAQRFRFNTIIQRYHSLQQYWGRVVREIENGTYRRDVMKAAARFSAEEVMTAVGKKRVERFKKLLENQTASAPEKAERRKRKPVYELEESDAQYSANDWRDEDYEAPTPPPQDALVHALVTASDSKSPAQAAADPAAARAAGTRPAEKKAGAGLRWGGGPARPVDPEAARRRLADIAAKVGDGAPPPPAPPSERGRSPLLSQPLDVAVGPETPAPAESPRPDAAGPRARSGRPERRVPPSNRPRPGLDDLRLREIYNQYVETKRKTKESTAGITYEKLADSLKVQADRLRAKHSVKNVDYEVVVKNGKALLKPILK
jgi:hypothetical protein